MNQRELKDLIMEAEAEFQGMMQKIEMEYSAPDLQTMKVIWMAMPQVAKDQAMKIDPVEFEKINKMMEGA